MTNVITLSIFFILAHMIVNQQSKTEVTIVKSKPVVVVLSPE